MSQLSNELKRELYREALLNGFNSAEYGLLLTGVDNLLNEMTAHTQNWLKGTQPDEYDIDGEEIKL